MAKIAHRDISPLLQSLRNFLLGRQHNNALRFEDGVANRTQPPPNLPDGPAHILSNNYYVKRDGRREVQPPTVVATSQSLLSSGKSESASTKLPTPGKVYIWD